MKHHQVSCSASNEWVIFTFVSTWHDFSLKEIFCLCATDFFLYFIHFYFFFVIGYKEIADKSHNKEYNWFSFLFFVILLFESSNWWDNRAAQYCIFIYAFHLLFCCLPIEHVFPWNYWQSHKKILLYLFKAQDTFVSLKEVCFVCVPVEKRYHLKLLIK